MTCGHRRAQPLLEPKRIWEEMRTMSVLAYFSLSVLLHSFRASHCLNTASSGKNRTEGREQAQGPNGGSAAEWSQYCNTVHSESNHPALSYHILDHKEIIGAWETLTSWPQPMTKRFQLSVLMHHSNSCHSSLISFQILSPGGISVTAGLQEWGTGVE